MPTITEGADADALDELSRRLGQAASELSAVYAPVRTALATSHWTGPDADHFASEWNGPSKARLLQTADALRMAATVLAINAQEQRNASNSNGGLLRFSGLGGPSSNPGLPHIMPWRIPGSGWWTAPLFGLQPGWSLPWLPIPRWDGLHHIPFGTYGPDGMLHFPDPGLTPTIPGWDSGTTTPRIHLTGSSGLTVGAAGLAAGLSGLAFAGYSGSTSGSLDAGPLHASADASGMVGVEAGGTASASIGRSGLDASADAHAFAGAKGEVGAHADLGPMSAAVEGSGMVGAEASGTASVHAGIDGFSAAASGGAFAGAAVQGSATAGISGGTVTATGGVEAGVGLSGEAKVSAGWHDTEIKLGGNAALGLGIKGSVDIHVDPSKIASDGAHLVGSAYSGAEDLLSSLPTPHWGF